MDLKVLQEFVEDAKLGLVAKEDIIAKRNEVESEIDSLNGEIADVETELRSLEDSCDAKSGCHKSDDTEEGLIQIEVQSKY